MSAGWRRNSNSVTIPKFPPPPRSPGTGPFCDWLACRISPLADTTRSRSGHVVAGQAEQPGKPAHSPAEGQAADAGVERLPAVVASPDDWAALSKAPSSAPPAPGPGAGPSRPGQRPPGTGQSSGRCQAPLGREYCGLLPGPQANHPARPAVTVRTCRVSLSAFHTTAVTSWTAATACSRSRRPMPPVSGVCQPNGVT